jgi:hypothetical protein
VTCTVGCESLRAGASEHGKLGRKRYILNHEGLEILRCLQSVRGQRDLRSADSSLAAGVTEVKRFQHARFALTYADLLAQRRYAAATNFFLQDLYGPGDFSPRDDQFARVVPALARLFPQPIVLTVAKLAQLHELSEALDTQMGRLVGSTALNSASYGRAWRTVDAPEQRERQICLMLEVGGSLDQFTKNLVLRGSLRMMRGPANAAGLEDLQRFLEAGFDAFREMGGAREFLETVGARERSIAANLFLGTEEWG